MKKLKKILYPICGVLLLFAVWNLWKIEESTKQTRKLYQNLARQAREASEDQSASQENVNSWLEKFKEQNPDLTGWLTIPGTVIDYPVMQTKTDNDYYMDHDFDGNENPHGALFLDFNCQAQESDNLIIYGHHMKDGTMFQNLMLYKDGDFCRSNGTIWYKTTEESTRYQVVFVMLLSAADAEKFPYYKCTDLSNEQIYQGYLKQCSRYATWSAEKLPDYGTRLLTLSTCEYSRTDGRLVVVAAEQEH